MKKLIDFFDNHWEKLLLALAVLFSVYSIGISLAGLLGSGNEHVRIRNIDKDITDILARGDAVTIDTEDNVTSDFKKKFDAREGFDAYQNLLMPARLFNQEAKVDPYQGMLDITQGHSSPNSVPGVNCEKFFCKVRGENICLICGAKGEREYKFSAPLLTDLSLIRENIRSALKTNPYMDRQKIRIIWEDDIETDRETFKDRKASVFRIELTEQNENELKEMFKKSAYQKEIRDYLREHKIRPMLVGKDSYDLVGANVGGAYYKAPDKESQNKKPEEKGDKKLDDWFDKGSSKEQEKTDAPSDVVKVERVHKLHDEKVFYNYEDTTFEPLKKYVYILFETFSGETVTHKPLSEWKFSNPVEITTSANNYVFLTRIVPILDDSRNPVMNPDGNPAYTAEVRIYQYFPIQDIFYRKDFRELKIGDEVGAFTRRGEEKQPLKTPIYKSKGVPLKGSDLSDDDWMKWKALYPNALQARSARLEVDQTYTLGAVIKNIGEEKVSMEVPDGKPIKKGFDEKGLEIWEQKMKTIEVIKKFILVENLLTKKTWKIYESSNKEIADEVEKQNIKTLDDIKR